MLRISPPSEKVPDTFSVADTEQITELANKLISRGKLAEALLPLTELRKQQPDNLAVHTTAGLIALRQENLSLAEQCLSRAVEISPRSFDANYNLALIHLMTGRDATALARLQELRRLYPDNAALLNDIAVIWSQRQHQARTLGAFGRALRLESNDSRTRNNAMQYCLEKKLVAPARRMLIRQEKSASLSDLSRAEIHRWREVFDRVDSPETAAPTVESITETKPVSTGGIKDKKIAFFATHQMFVKDLTKALSERNSVRMFDGGSADELIAMLEWADLVWFEWCDNLIVQATRLPKKCKMVCRLHSYEAFTDMPSQVDWSKIDQLVFVNQSVMEIAKPQIGNSVPLAIVHNGVDLDKFAIPPEKFKAGVPISKKIASVGYINYKKNPGLLLYCFSKIHQIDPEYTLHIAGEHQDPRIKLYFDNFLRRHPLPVHFDGWVEDMPVWYADKGFVISTSLFESFHYSIAEGMASGLIPLIHDWYGADLLYPGDSLFATPDECATLIKKAEKADLSTIREANRQYIADRYDQRDKLSELSNLLTKVMERD